MLMNIKKFQFSTLFLILFFSLNYFSSKNNCKKKHNNNFYINKKRYDDNNDTGKVFGIILIPAITGAAIGAGVGAATSGSGFISLTPIFSIIGGVIGLGIGLLGSVTRSIYNDYNK